MKLTKKEVGEIIDVLILHGFVEDVGRNEEGEIVYQLTQKGRDHAELLKLSGRFD